MTQTIPTPQIGDRVYAKFGSPKSHYRVVSIIATGPQAGWLKLATNPDDPKCRYHIAGHPSVMVVIAETK